MMDPLIKTAYQAAAKGQSFAFATIVESSHQGTPRKTGAKMIVMKDHSIFGTIGGGVSEAAIIKLCQEAMKSNKPQLVEYHFTGKKGEPICGGSIKVFIEPFTMLSQILICGAGHIALPLSVIAKILQYSVTILDERKDFANKKRFPHVDAIICKNYQEGIRNFQITENTKIVILTPGHTTDYICLREAIQSPAPYIGVISSAAKRKKFMHDLKKLAIPRHCFKKISMPVGIDIGAQTPEEIALAIMAEVVQQKNLGQLNSLKFVQKQNNNTRSARR